MKDFLEKEEEPEASCRAFQKAQICDRNAWSFLNVHKIWGQVSLNLHATFWAHLSL